MFFSFARFITLHSGRVLFLNQIGVERENRMVIIINSIRIFPSRIHLCIQSEDEDHIGPYKEDIGFNG